MVVQLADEEIDRIFHALADRTRRDIVAQVLRREQSISSLAGRYAMSFAAVQKHVAVLTDAGLVVKERRGREQIVHGDTDALREAARLLGAMEEIWRHRVQGIDAVLSGATDEKEETQ